MVIMNLFESKDIKPMLIGETGEPFDHPDYIYELKLDGERCLAYLDRKGTELRNKRNVRMLPKVPELSDIHKQAKAPCILDGELIIVRDGMPDFHEIQRRSLMSDKFRIELAAKKSPATFAAFDILCYDGKAVMDQPLTERKKLLEQAFRENERLALSRYIETEGTRFFQLAKEKNLEGIVAKKKDSRYHPDTRTKEWIKIKFLKDADFVVCGYIIKDSDDRNTASIILGLYDKHQIIYQGHVSIGINRKELKHIMGQKKAGDLPLNKKEENAVYIEPNLVCTVTYLERMEKGGLRHANFKGLRNDKTAKECGLEQFTSYYSKK